MPRKADPDAITHFNTSITNAGKQRWRDKSTELGVDMSAMLQAVTEDLDRLFGPKSMYIRRARTIQATRSQRSE